ncbi:MAG TPA: twin-arginine translocase subunit TatC [Solirubrobacteraceae bacterium]|jgi:sec-independent protein translocase protein TatC|nr:twin-arginine translocase subunit TatC [Solirubrobacteraceae bacterium]
MPALRPVGHDERLSIVEHLDELRSRIIVCLIVFTVAFGICYWQNDRVLRIVNHPVAGALSLKTNKHSNDPDRQSATFERKVGALARTLPGALRAVQSDVADPAARRALEQTIRAAQAAAQATPTLQSKRPITFGVTEPFLTTFKVAGYSAILLVLPFLLYQLYAFVLPAFTPRERNAVLPVLMLVPLLFVAGVLFGYFVALPRAANFLLGFNSSNFDIELRAQDYYSFTITFLGALGLVFQVPIAVMALVRLGVVSTRQLRRNRGYAILLIAIIAAVVTPTPDPVTMLITMAPLVLLFELSILLARALERRRPQEDDEEELLPLDEDPFDTATT